jgi:hypothetical protein
LNLAIRGRAPYKALLCALTFAAFAGQTAVARAQDAAPAPSASPAATQAPADGQMTPMDRQYDGKLHGTITPYVWLPTLHQNLQYTLPTLPQHTGGTFQKDLQVGPSDYLAKINSTIMFSASARQGLGFVFGDYIYTNLSTNSNIVTSITGPLGHVTIPVHVSTSSRLASSIWELAGGFTLAHGHSADLNFFAGWRQFPINLTLGYNATLGQHGLIAPSGTLTLNRSFGNFIYGLQGKAYFDNARWFVPYYVDFGAGNEVQSWQGYVGAGYQFPHGQSLLLTYRNLSYYGFALEPPIQLQRVSLGGPLLGYTMNL